MVSAASVVGHTHTLKAVIIVLPLTVKCMYCHGLLVYGAVDQLHRQNNFMVRVIYVLAGLIYLVT